MSRINRLLKICSFVIAVLICYLQTGCVNNAMRAKYTKDEVLAMGSEFAAAGQLSPQAKIEGERISEPSLLYGKWRAKVNTETIKIGHYWSDDEAEMKVEGMNICEYDFKQDGTYVFISTSCTKIGSVIMKSVTDGKWHLQNGELTLISTKTHTDARLGTSLSEFENDIENDSNKNLIGIPVKYIVTAGSAEGISIYQKDFSFWMENLAKSQEKTLANTPPNLRERMRKYFAQSRYECGYDSRGYCVTRMWSVDDDNYVQMGVMSIVTSAPALYIRVEKISE